MVSGQPVTAAAEDAAGGADIITGVRREEALLKTGA